MTGPENADPTGLSKGFADVESSPWVVLGGGGLKGLAHIGAWQAIAEAGIRPAGIIGTSIGALIGALGASSMGYLEGRRHALALERADIIRVNRRAVWINGIRQVSIFRGDVLREHFAQFLPSGGWDALEIPLLINAVDLGTGATVWFGTGERVDVPLDDAVYASSALPVFYPPFETDEQVLVDGGTEHPLPIQKAAAMGAERVIAIDVGAGRAADAHEAIGQGLLGVHQRIYSIMTHRRRREALARWTGPPLLYVRPELDGYGTFDFEHIPYFLDEGYRATREALAR